MFRRVASERVVHVIAAFIRIVRRVEFPVPEFVGGVPDVVRGPRATQKHDGHPLVWYQLGGPAQRHFVQHVDSSI